MKWIYWYLGDTGKWFCLYLNQDFLTELEVTDVEVSWKEIEQDAAKKFRSVDEFLEELKK